MSAENNQAEDPLKGMNEGQDLIRLFTSQIKELKQLAELGSIETPQCKKRTDDIKTTALEVLQKIEEQKKSILKKIGSGVLLPAAKGIVDEMSRLTDDLRALLEKNLKELEPASEVDWREQAMLWAQLYAKWHDHKAIEEDIVQFIAVRISQMISKDLQVIDEYQSRSLEETRTAGNELDTLRVRLRRAIEVPMQAMDRLKEPPSDICIEKIGEWVSAIQEEREKLFDSVLQRIEKVTSLAKPFASVEIVADPILEIAMNHEIIALQHEFNDILGHLRNREDLDKNERRCLVSHLESLIDHAQELLIEPSSLQCKGILQDFIEDVYAALDSLRDNNP